MQIETGVYRLCPGYEARALLVRKMARPRPWGDANTSAWGFADSEEWSSLSKPVTLT